MKRNKYSKEFEEDIKQIAKDNTLDILLNFAKQWYNYDITKDQLRQYLSKRKIRYKDYNNRMIHPGNKLPIGSEYIKDDEMTLIKISEDKWEYKQRYIYEQYYNVDLDTKTMVIFLNGDKKDFRIENLMAVSTPEYNCIRNKKLISNNSEVTKTAILSARLMYKSKDIEKKLK